MSECCIYATNSDCMDATISLFFIKSIHIAVVTHPHGSRCAIWRRWLVGAATCAIAAVAAIVSVPPSVVQSAWCQYLDRLLITLVPQKSKLLTHCRQTQRLAGNGTGSEICRNHFVKSPNVPEA